MLIDRIRSAFRRRKWELIEYLGDILVVGVALFSRPRGWEASEWSWWGFYVPFVAGVSLVVIGKWKQGGERRRLSEILPQFETLESDNAQLRGFAQDAINQELMTFADEMLEFSTNERVSVYYRRPDGFFQLVGRYSPHTTHGDYGRTVFSDKESFLVKTYRNGECDETLVEKSVDAAAWRDGQQESGLSQKVIRNLRMPSTHYVGFVLRNSSQVDFAVIMFESVRTNVLVKNALRVHVDGPYGDRVKRVLEQIIKFLPDPKSASEAGL